MKKHPPFFFESFFLLFIYPNATLPHRAALNGSSQLMNDTWGLGMGGLVEVGQLP